MGWTRTVLAVLAVASALPVWGADDLLDLARQGDWARVLAVARTRAPQLPLRPDEAMVASAAAVRLGDLDTAKALLESMVSSPELAEVAAVELAEALAGIRPADVLPLAELPARRGATDALRDAATAAIVRALEAGLGEEDRRRAEDLLARVPSPRRRQLELALAPGDGDGGRARLGRLLASSQRDLVALGAAERLASRADLSAVERWRVGAALFHHAHYDRAAELLEPVALRPGPGVPGSEAAFLRGRCDFRRERWREAVAWYERAAERARAADERADLGIHVARSLELAGDLDGAVAAGRRAVQLRASDDRRLLLARLRLRRGELELARYGLDRLQGRTARDRGHVLLAVAARRRGDAAAAERELERLRTRTWAAVGAVLRAALLLERGEPGAALEAVDVPAVWRSPFWAGRGRELVTTLTPELLESWRAARGREPGPAGGGDPGGGLLSRAALEIEPGSLEELAAQVVVAPGAAPDFTKPGAGERLGVRLWRLGLTASAVRWDPRALEDGSPEGDLWLAGRALEQGVPWRSISLADGAWRRLGRGLPDRVAPRPVRLELHPLPWPEALRQAAEASGIAPSLLAAIAREESRWRPDALSPVGARGLTQMMPATALRVAASAGLPPPSAEALFDPELSLRLAGIELGRLLAAFGGLEAAAVAAYNAGEPQARIWLEECGPLCDDSWYTAAISFSVTRDYVSAVLASRAAYRELGVDRVSG